MAASMPTISYKPRGPYSPEELRKLYPTGLRLKQVQVLERHGERTPGRSILSHLGLPKYWPGCTDTELFNSAVLSIVGGAVPQTFTATHMSQIKKLETFGENGEPISVTAPKGASGGLCGHGELTDIGRQSAFGLGGHLRSLYVDQLKFMPETLDDHSTMYLRTTPLSRTLVTLQETIAGMYSPAQRVQGLGPFPIATRSWEEETHYPMSSSVCPRYAELFQAFIKATADKENGNPKLEYVSSKIGKFLPASSNGKVRTDKSPTMGGILDNIHSSLGSGGKVKLPSEFYDPTSVRYMQEIGSEAVFQGLEDSLEYRTLGAGPVMSDVMARMMTSIGHTRDSPNAVTTDKTKFVVLATHDTTLGAALYGLGAKKSVAQWPPYTSHVDFELFEADKKVKSMTADAPSARDLTTKRTDTMTKAELKSLDGHYVRVKYNDELVFLPACAADGNHLPGDKSLCTLKVFKETVDAFRPVNFHAQCRANVGRGIIDAQPNQ